MKTLSTLLLSFICLFSLKAQSTDLAFDFKTKEFTGTDMNALDKLKTGDLYQLKINNINLNLWKVTVTKRDTIIESTPLSFPSLSSFSLGPIMDIMKNFFAGNLLSGLSSELAMNKEHKSLSENDVLAFNKEKEIFTLIDNYQTLIRNYAKQLEEVRSGINDLLFKYDVYRLSSQCDNLTSDLYVNYPPQNIKILDIRKEFDDLRIKCNTLYDNIFTSNEDYIRSIKKYEPIVAKKDQMKEQDKAVRDAFANLLSSGLKAKETISADSIHKYLNQFIDIQNASSSTYISMPMQFTKDEGKLTISIEPFAKNSKLQTYKTEIVFPKRRKIFFGVSAGIFGSFLSNDYYSFKTITDSLSGDTVYNLVKENPDAMELGFNSMFRLGVNICNSNVNWHLGIGPAITITPKVYPRIQLGTGLAFGKRHLFLVDLGVVAGPVERLSRAYNENASYSVRPSQVTVTNFAANFYFSFGYMFKI